ncbi:MAG: right-handed parallel beta-helix repeat-containing protein [Candidatus Levybacteria bacterium]|nr:right-handed parallel beta-helix repeat-containing protein [Candidatus Levybacteria bacterium]
MHFMRKYFSTYFSFLEKQDKRTRVLLLVAVFGILLFLGLAVTLPFKDSLFQSLFPKPPSQAQETKICQASDAVSWKDCGNKINSNLADNIEITTLITCSGPNACPIQITNVNRPVRIYGTPNSSAGLKRIDNYTYPLLSISGSNGIRIENLHFDETTASCSSNCRSTLAIANSQNITFDTINVLYPKVMGLEISNVDTITVTNSKFINASVFGIWMSTTQPYIPKNAHITNNLFLDTKSNAVFFSATATPENPSTINGNTFIHNHREAIFSVCGGGNYPCSGGQLLLAQGTNNLKIEGNIIKEGKIDAHAELWASGIEVEQINIHNVTITRNDIHDNRGYGIVAVSNPQNVDGVTISDNKLYRNSFGNFRFATADIRNNCESATGCFPLTKGSIYAYPNPCIIYQGQDRCTATIHWTTNDATNTKVEVGGGGLFSTNPQGTQDASWITAAGATFNLYSGTTLLDSVFVKGIPSSGAPPPGSVTPTPTSTPIPTPTPTPKPTSTSTLSPNADLYVEKETPSKNFGGSINLKVDASPKDNAYLRFDTATLAGRTLVSAKLRIYVTDPTSESVSISGAGTSWSEYNTTWNTRPNIISGIATTYATTAYRYYDIDVASYVSSRMGQKVGFAITTSSTNLLSFLSKESSTNKPQLVITYR